MFGNVAGTACRASRSPRRKIPLPASRSPSRRRSRFRRHAEATARVGLPATTRLYAAPTSRTVPRRLRTVQGRYTMPPRRRARRGLGRRDRCTQAGYMRRLQCASSRRSRAPGSRVGRRRQSQGLRQESDGRQQATRRTSTAKATTPRRSSTTTRRATSLKSGRVDEGRAGCRADAPTPTRCRCRPPKPRASDIRRARIRR